MSQRCVEILLGRILTDEDFRREFFGGVTHDAPNFDLAASQGLSLTVIERAAVSRLEPRRVDLLARTLDPRIARSSLAATSDATSSPEIDPASRDGREQETGELEAGRS